MKKTALNDVGENAHDLAHDLKTDLANLSNDAMKMATDYLAPRARDLADYLAPRVRDAAEHVQPLAQDLGRRGAQFASDARDSLQPKLTQLASDARDTLQPKLTHLAADALENVQPYLEDARDLLQPRLEDARARVQPLVEAGRQHLANDVVPRINEAIDTVVAMPQTQEARDRLLAARAALAGELTLPPAASAPAKRSLGKRIVLLLLAGGLLAGVAYAIRRLLAPEDSGWQAHEPSQAYRRDSDEPDLAAAEESDASPAARRAAADSDPFVVSPYGEGSYVGVEPGSDFAIKGNERSMKYHVQGSAGYDRTIADVWFDSEEAAQAAGFTKAQR